METDKAIAFKHRVEEALIDIIREERIDPRQVQVRVVCVHDTGSLLTWDVIVGPDVLPPRDQVRAATSRAPGVIVHRPGS